MIDHAIDLLDRQIKEHKAQMAQIRLKLDYEKLAPERFEYLWDEFSLRMSTVEFLQSVRQLVIDAKTQVEVTFLVSRYLRQANNKRKLGLIY